MSKHEYSTTFVRFPGGVLTALTLSTGLGFFHSGCRTAQLPIAPLSESAVRLDLPIVRQDALYDCGLASLSALCQYWGIQIPNSQVDELARNAAENEGLSGSEMVASLERLGLDVFLFRGSLDRAPTGLYTQIDAGRPPLVMLEADGGGNHYGLLLGYDQPRGNVILLDPMKGEIVVPVAVFDRKWARCERFTLLACRKQVQGVTMARDEPRTHHSTPIGLAFLFEESTP